MIHTPENLINYPNETGFNKYILVCGKNISSMYFLGSMTRKPSRRLYVSKLGVKFSFSNL